MGQDKGLMRSHGLAWVERLTRQLSALQIPVYTSVNAGQQPAYRHQAPAQSLVVDASLAGINGPLKGILSAHRAYPEQPILFVPCDMPLLETAVFALWQQSYARHHPAYELFVSQTADQLQPLCGIYAREALARLDVLYRQGALKDLSMHAILHNLMRTYLIRVPGQFLPQFKNFNNPEDLA